MPSDTTITRSQRFPKKEKLCSKRIIDDLFKNGESFTVFPFRVVWLQAELPEAVPTQIVMSVPKRRIKKAADRNRIKRLMREGWRKHKYLVNERLDEKGVQWAIMLIYTGKEGLEYAVAEEKIILILQRLLKKIV